MKVLVGSIGFLSESWTDYIEQNNFLHKVIFVFYYTFFIKQDLWLLLLLFLLFLMLQTCVTTPPVVKSALYSLRQSVQNYKTFFQFIWHWQILKVQAEIFHVRTLPWADFFFFFLISTENIFSPSVSQNEVTEKLFNPDPYLGLLLYY